VTEKTEDLIQEINVLKNELMLYEFKVKMMEPIYNEYLRERLKGVVSDECLDKILA
jgi:hypothetical protein